MTLSRRSLLGAGATGAVALTAGCLDFVRGEGPLEFEANQVVPSASALAETGYEEDEIEHKEIDEEVDIGVEREIRASLWAGLYTKERELQGQTQDAGLFAAVSIPGIEVLGRSFNPLADLSGEELLEELMSQLDGEQDIDNISHEDSFGLEILGEGREVTIFGGEAEYGDEVLEVEIALTSFIHEDDLLVLLGTHPRLLAGEAANIERLMESVEHPV
ncbi:DUF6517 family protein [Natronolimnobius baerhuensis]|uniref:Uncharacterized protein n=1 Tax=Natronolimnobius baerhuensis TaxID=253108 RepID=A0A202E7Z1_9EURY|nr:DUF6517 family protein [Natronolimnobius baerhuensis]OVE84382.1 hypothetical protein B2G88_08180 [Natronolimnobius baerhuensis]